MFYSLASLIFFNTSPFAYLFSVLEFWLSSFVAEAHPSHSQELLQQMTARLN
ncbi:hypothetical protein DPMN_145188 [Dreissena polymorpha]|uniref:Uncharacterized protein n=1 Tax=Dreissena polymorpha TaxID=45954 RepID=A0A9D4F5J2_DREPO|nr:hypothetical protein DPMN_145188 [Dreissena polymorpha]